MVIQGRVRRARGRGEEGGGQAGSHEYWAKRGLCAGVAGSMAVWGTERLPRRPPQGCRTVEIGLSFDGGRGNWEAARVGHGGGQCPPELTLLSPLSPPACPAPGPSQALGKGWPQGMVEGACTQELLGSNTGPGPGDRRPVTVRGGPGYLPAPLHARLCHATAHSLGGVPGCSSAPSSSECPCGQ